MENACAARRRGYPPVMRKFPCSSKASLYLRTTWFKPRSSS